MYYQATSNSWTFLETNIGIICACLPVLKAPIIKFFPWLMRNKSSPSAYAYGFSRDQYTKKDIIPSHNGSVMDCEREAQFRQSKMGEHANASDEEFILEEMNSEGGVRKTTEINVTYEAMSMKGGKGGKTKGIEG
ncbi:integral membrane protein [Rutstroemia sp. NJR-2017a BVV2]|nr:integral membrane protein [Rutstroemia sp. NJR-2017a BVV2]